MKWPTNRQTATLLHRSEKDGFNSHLPCSTKEVIRGGVDVSVTSLAQTKVGNVEETWQAEIHNSYQNVRQHGCPFWKQWKNNGKTGWKNHGKKMGSGAPLWIWHTTRIPIVLPQKTLRFYSTFPRQGGARCFCLRKGVIEATKGMVSLPSLNSCQVFQLLTAAEFPALFHQCCQCLYMSRGLCESMLEYTLNQHPPFMPDWKSPKIPPIKHCSVFCHENFAPRLDSNNSAAPWLGVRPHVLLSNIYLAALVMPLSAGSWRRPHAPLSWHFLRPPHHLEVTITHMGDPWCTRKRHQKRADVFWGCQINWKISQWYGCFKDLGKSMPEAMIKNHPS